MGYLAVAATSGFDKKMWVTDDRDGQLVFRHQATSIYFN